MPPQSTIFSDPDSNLSFFILGRIENSIKRFGRRPFAT